MPSIIQKRKNIYIYLIILKKFLITFILSFNFNSQIHHKQDAHNLQTTNISYVYSTIQILEPVYTEKGKTLKTKIYSTESSKSESM
jgi:hypothetical protein